MHVGAYENTATVTGDQTDPVSGNNTSTVTPVPISQTDLAVTKTVNNATPNVGGNVTFTISVNNVGPSDATGVNVNDLLPSGYTYVSSVPSSGTYTSGTGLWAVGSLTNGATATLTITAKVNATGPYANTATVTGDQTDPVSGNNTSTVTPAPIPQSDLAVTKTVNNATPNVGGNVIFTISVNNAGPSDATGVKVNDILPSGYTYVSSVPSSGTYTNGTGLWAIGNLANGSTATLTITAKVNATGSYANTATVTGDQTDPVSGNNTASVTPAPIPQSDLAVTKTVNNATPNIGCNVIFTISVNNDGPNDATGVKVNDLLPSGYTYESSAPSSGTYTSGTGLWAVGNLTNGATDTLTITAKVNATGPYANTATVTGDQTDPVSGNNASTVTPAPIPQSDLAVTKTVDNAVPKVGSNVIFTIVATNNGPSAATGVSVEDILPTGYTFVSVTPTAGTSWAEPTWAIGNLANGATTSLTITATVKATGSYLNIAAIKGDQADPISGNDFATSKPIPVPQTNLAVTKTVNNATPFVGNNVTFTITATNNGPSAATGVKVTDNLPAGYTFVSATPSAGTSWSGSTWTIGNLANGASATLTITARVKITGPYSNTATITGDQIDPISGNDSAGATTTPVIPADLQVVKTASNLNPDVGSHYYFHN